MAKLWKWIAALLLLTNGVGALAAGYSFIAKPDGSGLQMPISFLHGTPFTDYFVPGLMLFVCNGVFSLCVLLALVLQRGPYAWLVAAQGCILIGWTIIQLLLIGYISAMQPLFLVFGLLLALCGRRLWLGASK